MEWLPIDYNNIPEHEILAANFKPGTYGYKEKLIGYLRDDGVCESARTLLANCTHYIDLNKHDL